MKPPKRVGSGTLLLCACALAATPGAARAQAAPPGGQDFPAFVWRVEHWDRPLPPGLVDAFGGVNVEGTEEAEWVRARGLDYYVGHGPGRDELHLDRGREWYDLLWKRYWDEREFDGLVRVPCLSEDATRALLKRRLERSLEARGGQHGYGISLGDEVGLTPWGDPFDLCTSESCRALWRGRYGEALGWDERMPATDALRRALTEGDDSGLEAWLARRQFHQDVVLETLRELADHARSVSPETPVGLFGSIGRTAFGGVSIEGILPSLDFIEVYALGHARELLYSLREERQRSLLTLAIEVADPGAAAWELWEHWLRGGDGVVIWSDRRLRDEACRERLLGALSDVRRVRARVGDYHPRPGGVALLHDDDSLALAWLRDALTDGPTWPKRFQGYQEEHGTREVAVRRWLRTLEGAGLLPAVLPLSRLSTECTERNPVLVACHLEVLGDEDLGVLRRHLRDGGWLVIDERFARYDRRCERRDLPPGGPVPPAAPDQPGVEEGALEGRERPTYHDLFRPELRKRVLFLQPGADAVHVLQGRCGEAWPVERRWSVRLGAQASAPLRATVEREAGAELVCAFLPLREEGRESVPFELELAEGWELEWLHPLPVAGQAPTALRPDEAGVFLLRRSARGPR